MAVSSAYQFVFHGTCTNYDPTTEQVVAGGPELCVDALQR